MSAPPSSSSSPSGNPTSRANHGNHQNNNKKKKEVFKGEVDGFEKVLQLPSERTRGVASEFNEFMECLCLYIGREVSPKCATAKVWATQYIIQDNQQWEPPFPDIPIKPEDDVKDKTILAKYEREVAIYESKQEGYVDAIGANWDAT